MSSPQDYRPINKNIPADNALGNKIKRAKKDLAGKPTKTPEQVLKEKLNAKRKQIREMVLRHASAYMENFKLKKQVDECAVKYQEEYIKNIKALTENSNLRCKILRLENPALDEKKDPSPTVCDNCEKRDNCPFSVFSKEFRVRVCPRAQELKHSLRHLDAVQNADNGKPMWKMRKDLESFLSKHSN